MRSQVRRVQGSKLLFDIDGDVFGDLPGRRRMPVKLLAQRGVAENLLNDVLAVPLYDMIVGCPHFIPTGCCSMTHENHTICFLRIDLKVVIAIVLRIQTVICLVIITSPAIHAEPSLFRNLLVRLWGKRTTYKNVRIQGRPVLPATSSQSRTQRPRPRRRPWLSVQESR